MPTDIHFKKSGLINAANQDALSNALIVNTPILILFPLLLILDIAWNLINGCADMLSLGMSVLISGIVGICWASIIASTNKPSLMYISKSMGNVCSKPTSTMFRCRTKKAD